MDITQILAQYMPQIMNLVSALLGSLVGAFLTLAGNMIFRKVQESGHISIYVRIVHSLSGKHHTWGFYHPKDSENDLSFHIPIWFEVVNTCGVQRVLRDVNLYIYSNGKEVMPFVQSQHLGNDKEKYVLGQNGAYTVVIPEKSSCRFDMEFFLRLSEMPEGHTAFDKIVLAYYDERDIFHTFDFATVKTCWTEGTLRRPKVWFRLNEKRVSHQQQKDAELPCVQ